MTGCQHRKIPESPRVELLKRQPDFIDTVTALAHEIPALVGCQASGTSSDGDVAAPDAWHSSVPRRVQRGLAPHSA